MRTKFKAEIFGASTKETLRAYFKLIRDYRRLAFTHETDVLRAFSGVMATFGGQMSTSFHFGLPLSIFSRALLMDYTQCVRRPDFPSWSLAGWSENRPGLWNYIGSILGEFRTTTIFYRLHPTSDNVNVQDRWTLEAIYESQTPGAEDGRLDLQSVYQPQQFPALLDRTSLEKLLVFDSPASNIEIKEIVKDVDQTHTFDIEHEMSFGTL